MSPGTGNVVVEGQGDEARAGAEVSWIFDVEGEVGFRDREEHVIDELSNSLFSISEPRWTNDEDSKKIKTLKRRVHDLYAKYKTTANK